MPVVVVVVARTARDFFKDMAIWHPKSKEFAARALLGQKRC